MAWVLFSVQNTTKKVDGDPTHVESRVVHVATENTKLN